MHHPNYGLWLDKFRSMNQEIELSIFVIYARPAVRDPVWYFFARSHQVQVAPRDFQPVVSY